MEQTATLNPVPASKGSNAWLEALRTPLALGLAALLGVQLLAAIALSLAGRGSLVPAALDSSLLSFDPAAITAIRIAGSGGSGVTLTRGDKGWLIADLGDFPADGAKADALVEKLAGLKRPLPVGTSAESLKRHKVADDGFERKVTLESGDAAVATLLLGDSPGFRRIFARPAGDAAVYDLDLALFDVSNRTDDWLDRTNLRLGREEIQRVSTSDWTLVKGEDGWQLQGSEQAPDRSAVDDLLSRISNLGYRGVLGTEDKPEYNQGSPILEMEVALVKGETRKYRISQVKDGQDFVLKASDRPWYFKLSEFDLEGLKDLDRNKLAGLQKPEQAAEPAEPPPADASGGETGVGKPGQSKAENPAGAGEVGAGPKTAQPDESAQPVPAGE